MKKLERTPFMTDNLGSVYQDSKGNYFVIGGCDKYLQVAESQIFDDYGNVSYEIRFI